MTAYAEGFSWTEKQSEAIAQIKANQNARHIGIRGGSRSGKTFLICGLIKGRALIAPESNHLLAREAFNHAKRSLALETFPEMDKLVSPGARAHYHKADAYFEYPNGSRVWIGGLDDKDRVDKILGLEFSTIYLNEASQISFDTVETVRGRLAETVQTLRGRPLRQIEFSDLNPTHSRHWTKREFIDGVSPETGLEIDTEQYLAIKMNPVDNRANLSEQYLNSLQSLSPLKRKRFYAGDYADDNENAIFKREWIKYVDELPELDRLVIGCDPSGGGVDEMGLIAVGKVNAKDGQPEEYYVLQDKTLGGVPGVRYDALISMYDDLWVDAVVGEKNYGGDNIEHLARTQARLRFTEGKRDRPELTYKSVTASRGKVLRADPVSDLYHQGVVYHLGVFPELEEEMCQFTTDWDRDKDGSPNRLDALVFAITELSGKVGRGSVGFIV